MNQKVLNETSVPNGEGIREGSVLSNGTIQVIGFFRVVSSLANGGGGGLLSTNPVRSATGAARISKRM
eukprot:scaffold1509_cov240-Pinguiococcus_pyrenoidosus.AAC.35